MTPRDEQVCRHLRWLGCPGFLRTRGCRSRTVVVSSSPQVRSVTSPLPRGCPEVRRSLRRSSRPVRSCWERSWSPNQVRQGQEDRHEEGIRLAGRHDRGGVGVAAACGDSGGARRARRGSEGGTARAERRSRPQRRASADGARGRRGRRPEGQAQPGPDGEASRSRGRVDDARRPARPGQPSADPHGR